MKLHEKIAYYRKRCCLSQEGLAEKVGVSRQAVSKWETGDALPEVTKLKALAQCFGVTVDFLLNEEETEYTPPDKQKEQFTQPDLRGFDRFDAWIDTLPEKIMPFLKKHGWIGGIVLAVVGTYNTVMSIIGCVTALTASSQFSTVGMGGFAVPAILSSFASVIAGVAMVVGGIIIVKKFKPKNKQ